MNNSNLKALALLKKLFQGNVFAMYKMAKTEVVWTSIILLIFAVIFLIVGLYRNVEFRDSNLSKRAKIICYVIHTIGVINFTLAILLVGADLWQTHQSIILPYFFSAIFLLFPLHIYLAISKRI